MATVEIYTTPMCPYCVRAKRLLSSKGVDFVEIDLWQFPARRDEMITRARGRRTVPQVFVDGESWADPTNCRHWRLQGGWTRCSGPVPWCSGPSRPATSNACNSSDPPNDSPSTKTCGTVRRPARPHDHLVASSRECQRSISTKSTPLSEQAGGEYGHMGEVTFDRGHKALHLGTQA